MKDEDRMVLTEWLGECWHEWEERWDAIVVVPYFKCCKCGCRKILERQNRTFDNWNDFGALWKVVLSKHHSLALLFGWKYGDEYDWADWESWEYLIPKDRCCVICKAIKERVI